MEKFCSRLETKGATTGFRGPISQVFRLAAADLRHEWVLTVCLVMAMVSVLAPLLLFFGLRHGIISTLRFRLMEDPRSREIRPLVSRSFNKDWLDDLRRRPEVAFIVPATRQLSAAAFARIKGRPATVETDLVPTTSGDVLLLGDRSPIPAPRECVLSGDAAHALHAEIGDCLSLQVSRIKGHAEEQAEVELRIAGILSPRACGSKSVFIRLELMDWIEQFKDGQAVPELGWPGAVPRAYPVYDGVVLMLPEALPKAEEYGLLANSGFTTISQPPIEEVRRKTGLDVHTNAVWYLLDTLGDPVSDEAVLALQARVRAKSAIILPWTKSLKADLFDLSGHLLGKVALRSLADPQVQGNPIEANSPLKCTADFLKIVLPKSVFAQATNIEVLVHAAENTLRFPVAVLPEHSTEKDAAWIPAQLAGILKLAELRNIKFDAARQEFLLSRRSYAGFRLYARAIEDVDRLRQHLESQGIYVSTEAKRIRDLLELDKSFGLIFSVVAGISVAGCLAALLASMYASVERKHRVLAILRLLGFPVRTLVWFPVFEAGLVTVCGLVLSFACFMVVAAALNLLFAQHLQSGEKLCTLSARHVAIVVGATLLIAAFASILAAHRAHRLQPADSLREE